MYLGQSHHVRMIHNYPNSAISWMLVDLWCVVTFCLCNSQAECQNLERHPKTLTKRNMSHQCSCHVQSSMATLILWCHISMMVLVSVTVDGMIIGNVNHLQLNILQDPAGSCSLQLDQQWQTIPSSPVHKHNEVAESCIISYGIWKPSREARVCQNNTMETQHLSYGSLVIISSPEIRGKIRVTPDNWV